MQRESKNSEAPDRSPAVGPSSVLVDMEPEAPPLKLAETKHQRDSSLGGQQRRPSGPNTPTQGVRRMNSGSSMGGARPSAAGGSLAALFRESDESFKARIAAGLPPTPSVVESPLMGPRPVLGGVSAPSDGTGPKLSALLPDDPLAEEEDQAPDPAEIKLKSKRCGSFLVFLRRVWRHMKEIDGMLVFLTLVIAAVALISYLAWPHYHVGANEFWRWPTMIVACVLFYHVAAAVEWGLIWLFSLSIATRLWRLYFYLSCLSGSFRKIALVVFLMWWQSGDQGTYWIHLPDWLGRVLPPVLAILIAHIIRKMVMKEFVFRVNRRAYTDKVESLLFYEHVLRVLLDPRSYVAAVKALSLNEEEQQKQVERSGLTPLRPEGGTVLLRLLQRIHDSAAPHHPATQDAKTTSIAIFANIDREGRGYLTYDDFLMCFPEEKAKRAFALFDNTEGLIAKKCVSKAVRKYLQDRQNLAHDLKDWEGISGVILSVARVIFWFLVLIVLIVVYGDSFTEILLPFGTLVLSLSFVFGSTLAQGLTCFVFIFVIKPYSVGDRVNVNGLPGMTDIRFKVRKIELYTTTFTTLSGLLVKFPNYLLVNYPIVNFTRSQYATFELPIWIDVNTPVEYLERLKKMLIAYLEARPKEWKKEVSMYVGDVSHDKNFMRATFWIDMNLKFADGTLRVYTVQTELVNFLRKEMQKLGIGFRGALQQVHLEGYHGNAALTQSGPGSAPGHTRRVDPAADVAARYAPTGQAQAALYAYGHDLL